MKNNKLALFSIWLSALTFPLTIATSKTFEYIIKSANPQNINVRYNLAYLKEIMIFGIAIFVSSLVISFICSILAHNKYKDDLSLLAIKLGVAQVIFALVILFIYSGLRQFN